MNPIQRMRKLAITIAGENWLESPDEFFIDILKNEMPSWLREVEDGNIESKTDDEIKGYLDLVTQKDYTSIRKLVNLFTLTYKILYGHLFEKNVVPMEKKLENYGASQRDWKYLKSVLNAFIGYANDGKDISRVELQDRKLIDALKDIIDVLIKMERSFKGSNVREVTELVEKYNELVEKLNKILKTNVVTERSVYQKKKPVVR